jgi:hypothetical protein
MIDKMAQLYDTEFGGGLSNIQKLESLPEQIHEIS